jgi:hypothetical protein
MGDASVPWPRVVVKVKATIVEEGWEAALEGVRDSWVPRPMTKGD